MPAFVIAIAACLLTALLWPIAAWSRRRHGVQLPVTGLAWCGHLASRVTAAALTLVTLGWFLVVVLGLKDLEVLRPPLDPVLLLLYLLSVVVYIGGAVVMLWSVRVSWITSRPMGARIWTAVLALSSLILLYFAVLYHLMSFATKY
jgi:hypothetical protein